MSSYTNRLSLPLPLPQQPVMDEEMMKQGNWMGSVLCVSFSILTVLVA